MTLNRTTQRGDTIIEVLICIALAALMIAGAYAISQRSLRLGIQAKEHSEALKIAQGQVEELKYRNSVYPGSAASFFTTYANPSGFCLSTDTTTNGVQTGANCLYDSKYTVAITHSQVGSTIRLNLPTGTKTMPAPHYYKVSVTWPRIGSATESDQEIIWYKFYESAP